MLAPTAALATAPLPRTYMQQYGSNTLTPAPLPEPEGYGEHLLSDSARQELAAAVPKEAAPAMEAQLLQPMRAWLRAADDAQVCSQPGLGRP